MNNTVTTELNKMTILVIILEQKGKKRNKTGIFDKKSGRKNNKNFIETLSDTCSEGQCCFHSTSVDAKTAVLTQEATSFRLFQICEIALSAADEMKSYNCCQEHINASAVQSVL